MAEKTKMINETKRSKHSQQTKRKEQPQQPVPLSKSLWRWLSNLSPTSKFCAWLVLFLTCIGAYYNFAFKLDIYPSGTLNQSDPFATLFIIKNNSLLWINNIAPLCGIRKVETDGHAIIENIGVALPRDIPPIPQLVSGEKTTIILPFRDAFDLSTPISYADIEIAVSYYVPIIFFYKKEISMRFVTIKTQNGNLQWISKAVSE
jgi:hypothetical protein